MRIALCLSGQPRSYKKAHEYIKRNLLDKYTVDVFAHAWRPQVGRMIVFDDINRLYSPIQFIMDEALPETINSDLFVPNASHPANFCTSMFYSIHRANDFRIREEAKKAKNYDFVVRSRYDLALNKVIDFSSLKPGVIYVSKDTDGPNPLLNDQFAIGDSQTMNIYSGTYMMLRLWAQKFNTPLCGHEMLQTQLNYFGIPVERIDIDHPFNDGKYNIGRHSIIRDDMETWVDPRIWGY